MTSQQSALASLPFHTYATGENGSARPSSIANAHASVLPTVTTFTTKVPQLASEKAQSTALFFAYEELRARVATWSTRLAQELASSVESSSTVEAAPLVATTIQGGSTIKTGLPRQSSKQSAGEAGSVTIQPHLGGYGIQRTNPVPADPVSGFVPLQPLPHSTVKAFELLASAAPAPDAPSSTSNPPHATSTASIFRQRAAAAAANSETGHSTLLTKTPTLPTLPTLARTTTPTPTPRPALPPWLEADMEVFFHDRLARAIQSRESQLINTIHECVQQELQRQQRRVETLESQQTESDKTKSHLQSKLDRRVDASNALRKEYYKQLLMLRELVSKQRNDPHTLKALEDVIATVVHGDNSSVLTTAKAGAAWLYPHATTSAKSDATGKGPSTGAMPSKTTESSMGMRKEKDKWEERAREAATECQQLHEQILLLKQQLEDARGLDGELWFATPQHGLYERQRMIDSVYKTKCTWAQVGDAVLELVNNDMVWEAVEDSAFRDKGRVSRGLEALILRGVAHTTGTDRQAQRDGDDETANESNPATRAAVRRRGSAFLGENARVFMCRTCNGCGYLDASALSANTHFAGAPDEEEHHGSYLRKTLAQVLELKATLEETTSRANRVEQELLRTVMEGAQTKERLERIEYARAHRVDCGLQVDLDDDDDQEINVDDLMHAYSHPEGGGGGDEPRDKPRRAGGRWKQYEHLIVELKSLLSERDAGLAQLRKTTAESQARLVHLQKTSQHEHERLQHELQTLKGSLVLALSSRNDVLEEKQAAVATLLRNLDRQKAPFTVSAKGVLLLSRGSKHADGEEVCSVDGNNEGDEEEDQEEEDEDEVTRTERMARRYSLAVGRVQREYDEQQQRLQQTEAQVGTENDTRKRTHSILLGSIAVSMASHPRDLFKALSSTHQELLHYRRSSQRASALQTDRLLTLTTHLAHISEELVMVKKRTSAEIEFWKLDCEKLEHANKSLTVDLETARERIDEANERTAEATARSAVKMCSVCAKHEARLLDISAQLLQENADSRGGGNEPPPSSTNHRPSSASAANGMQLNEAERHGLGAILLDLENPYSTLSSSKQRHAKEAIARALLSDNGETNLHTQSLSDGLSHASTLFSVPLTHGNTDEPNAATRRSSSQIASPSTGARLFPDSLAASLQRHCHSSASPFVVQGSSISTLPFADENLLQPHYRKKIVRKVLSEQDALIRQRAQSPRRQYAVSEKGDTGGDHDMMEEPTDPVGPTYTPEEDEVDDVEPPYSTYLDQDGKQVYFVDVEVKDEEEGEHEAVEAARRSTGSNQAMDPLLRAADGHNTESTRDAASSRRVDLFFQIPTLGNPTGGPLEDSRPLCNDPNAIEKDPEVIQKLRELVSHHAKARERLVLLNWRIFMTHFQASRDQRRLDCVNDTWRVALVAGRSPRFANSLPQAVRTTMQKIVQWREFALDDAIRQRDELRKESRRAQAHLIHGVSTVLTDLTRKSKTSIMRSDDLPLVHIAPQLYSPRRSPGPMHSPSRPLYPSTRVNLSKIPATQHVPTPSFPLPVESHVVSASQSIVTPQNPSPIRIATSGEPTIAADEVVWTPSIFEHDNHFPQRSVKFVPVGGGDDLSLTHSTSPFLVATPSHSPSKSPSRAGGLSVDARRRPIHSAGPTLGGSFDPPIVDPSLIDPAHPVAAHFLDLFARRPMRPQSSPAGPRTRFRPSSAKASHLEADVAVDEIRSPAYSVPRPSSSRAER